MTHRTRLAACALFALALPVFAANADPSRTVPAERRSYVDTRLGQVHVRRIAGAGQGTAAPILLIHQTPWYALEYSRVAPLLAAAGHVVLAPDTPGFGMSDAPRERPGIADYARAHAALIESLGHETYDVLGYHTGANIAVEIAALFPHRVTHVAMIGAPLFTAEEAPERRKMFGPVQIAEDGSHMPPLWAKSMRWNMAGRTKEMLAALFHERLRRPDISWWGHSAVYDHDLAERMKSLHQPVALFNPHDDIQTFTERGRALLKPGDRFVDLPGWSHGFLDLKTQEFAARLRDFLAY